MLRYFFLILIFLPSLSVANTEQEWLQQASLAEKYYYNGEYQAAISQWNNFLVAGKENAWINYNLGNAYYRLGQLPYAKAYYLKAKKDLPRSPKIAHNLRLIENNISRPLTSIERVRLMLQLNIYEAAGVLAVLSVVLAGLLYYKKRGTWVLALLYAMFLSYYCYLTWNKYFVHQAVMLYGDKLLLEPVAGSPQTGSLLAGQVVYVESEEGLVVLVRDAQGATGWVNKQNLILL